MSWICPKCETENPDRLNVCEVCDSPRESTSLDKTRKKYINNVAYKTFSRYHLHILDAAELGDTNAQYEIGEWFLGRKSSNLSIDNNIIAVFWYRKAAIQGLLEAQLKLASCYEEGYGVIKSKIEAIKWYQKAANSGSEYAKQKVIELKYNKEIYRNILTYRLQLLKDADNGKVNCQFKLGEWFSNHNNKKEAIVWYTRAAKSGHGDAMLKLGECYEYGVGVYNSFSEAIKWYKKAAKSGNDSACLRLARAYLYGKMVTKNVEEALKWYNLVGRGLDAADLCNIGYAYDTGDTISINKSKAVEYYRQAAEKGDSVAQYNMGVCYENGNGVSCDMNVAKYWYEKAAKQGYEQAKQRVSSIQFDVYTKEQNNKGCLTYIVTGIVALIGLVILINQPEESWGHNKLIFDYEIGNVFWICSIILTYFISKNIFGYEE